MAAAVADYRPAQVAQDKIKKHDGELSIELERTDDILGWVGEHKPERLFVCGFSMETKDLIENSTAKLHKKNMDMIVANNVKVPGAGFGVDTNVVTLITESISTALPLQSRMMLPCTLRTSLWKQSGENRKSKAAPRKRNEAAKE